MTGKIPDKAILEPKLLVQKSKSRAKLITVDRRWAKHTKADLSQFEPYKEKPFSNSNFHDKWGLKSVVKNAFQAIQAEIASNMPAPY